MKRLKLFAVVIAFSTLFSYAQVTTSDGSALWMRYSAISPDGGTIAFAYKGDIFTVPAGGGETRQITSNAAFDSRPVWSPDGTKIAFASYRNGGADVYIVAKKGGEPFRVTTHSCDELPVAFMNDSTILYSAHMMPDPESMQFPNKTFPQVYAININGGRPKMFSSLPLESITFSPDGKTILYHDKKGVEDEWRKHHTSSVTRDIWSCEFEGGSVKHGKFTKISKFEGEDRNPVFSPDGKSFYYLSEQGGSFNVWKSDLKGENPVQITKFTTNPVRFLSIASDGTLCFGYDGKIYTCDDSGNAKKVDVKVFADKHDKDLIKEKLQRGGYQTVISKDSKQVAFIYSGDVYVTATEYKTTKRITNTAEEERDLDFAPDGRSLIYSSERNGVWQIYRTSIVNENEKYFPYCTEIKEDRITDSDITSFQPLFKPDGKEIAFLENRIAIKVINLETKKVRTVMDGKYQYSYTDGDQWYQWSPDGKWILAKNITEGGWNHSDVVLIDASGNSMMYNLTNSGKMDINPQWVLDGKAMTWFSNGSKSVNIMFFDKDAYIKFNMSKKDEEELALREGVKQEEKEKEEVDQEKVGRDKKKSSKKDKKAKEKPKDSIVLDLENAENRVENLVSTSLFVSDAVLNKDGSKLYYISLSEDLLFDLWEKDLKKHTEKIFIENAGQGNMILSDDGKSIFLSLYGSPIRKIDLASGKVTPVEIDGVFEYKPYAEREYIFNHVWKVILDKFYDPDIHGIDWTGYKKIYSKFLPYINNNFDFAEMLGEMLGELNASHTGARYKKWSKQEFTTAFLGAFYDETYTEDGLKIKEIIKRGPFTLVKSDIKAGDIIEKIDGEPILAGKDYFPLLEGKVGQKIRLTVFNPETKKHFDIIVKGIRSVDNILYKRWVDRNKELVDKYSDGKIGYVHIAAMDKSSYNKLYKELLGRYRNKEAVVIDTRHNGGGLLHDEVATLLSGKEYLRFTPRGQYVGSDPLDKWKKPSCMMIGEDNYSDAHGTPWTYHTLGIGKLVGTPVPGTMTAVWWESQLDSSITIGIPEVGAMPLNGKYLENQQLEPDILIYNAPEDFLNGYDAQLEGAVKSLMK